MRLSLVPENILERSALALNLAPGPLMSGMWGMGLTRTFLAGVRLGVFEAIGREKKNVEEIARLTNCDPRGMQTLLNALNGFRFLKRQSGLYWNRKTIVNWFLPSARFPMIEVVPFFYDLWDALGNLEDAVRTGTVQDFHRLGRPPELWDRYLRALAVFAQLASKEILWRVKLKGEPKRMLDVGGGHGIYSAAFCRKYPSLHSEILDLPDAVPVGTKLVSEQGMADRVTFREGDLRTAEWGSGYDVILIFNIIHNISAEAAREAIAKAHAALKPDGILMILESEHIGGDGDLSMVGGFNELFFFMITGAQAYPEERIRGWMSDAGSQTIQPRRLLSLPSAAVLSARRSAG